MTPEQRTRRKTIRKLWKICRPVPHVPDPRIWGYREALTRLRQQWHQVQRITRRFEEILQFNQFPTHLARSLYDRLSELATLATQTQNQSATWLAPPRAPTGTPTVWTYDAFRLLVAEWDIFEREYGPTWDGPIAVITLGPWDMTNPHRPSDGEVTIGPLRVRIDLSRMAGVQIFPTPECRVYNDRCHPHVNVNGVPCWGEGRLMGPRALANGRLVEGIDMLNTVLSEYNPDSPYVKLERFSRAGDYCPFCEEEMDEGSGSTCEACGIAVCEQCYNSCSCCDCTFCPDHSDLEDCHVSGEPLCPVCRHICHVCEYAFADAYGEECPDCHRWICRDHWNCPTCGTNGRCDNCGPVCADCDEPVCDECGQSTDDGLLCRSCYEARDRDGETAVSPPRIRVDETATPVLPGLAAINISSGDPPF